MSNESGGLGSLFQSKDEPERGSFRRAARVAPYGGSFHIYLAVVAAVEMRKSALSISEVCGKGGKRQYRFPGFP